MKIYLAAEGGGSKLELLVYEENGNILGRGRMTGVNTILRSKEDVRHDMEQLLDSTIPKEVQEIAGADISLVKYEDMFAQLLANKYRITQINTWGEGHVALASTGYLYGIVAQSGTGSDAFIIQEDKFDFVGAWGFILGDEGSGYDIGRNTLRAAIYAEDGRGPNTIITDLLKSKWQLNKLWDMVQRVSEASDYRQLIASASRIAAEASAQADPVALRIYENAAHEMSALVLAGIKRNSGTWEGPIVISGGAWKGSSHMFNTFCSDIMQHFPHATILRPIFEPVIGCVVLRCFQEGLSFLEFLSKYKQTFCDYIITTEVRNLDECNTRVP